MNKEGHWWDSSVYDQRVARAVTDLFDQLVGESLDIQWKGILNELEAFLKLCGVKRDVRLKVGLKHGELPPVLQNNFQENSRGSGCTHKRAMPNCTDSAPALDPHRIGWHRIGHHQASVCIRRLASGFDLA